MEALAEVSLAGLTLQAWYTILVIVLMVIALVKDLARTDYVLLGGLGLVLIAGIVTPQEAFAGFSNPAVLTVASLFVVAEAVHRTDSLRFMDGFLFSRSAKPARALPPFMLTTAGLSAFLNNTPVVAMLIPRVQDWSERVGLSPSKTLIPLSYAAILGGLITLLGTSTNIVVSGLLEDHGLPPLQMFELTWVGLPAAIAVILFFVLGGHRLLPGGSVATANAEAVGGEYFFELRVRSDAAMVGKTVEAVGLRALGDAYLVRVLRSGRAQEARPDMTLVGGDILSFSGSKSTLKKLLERDGLETVVASVSTNEEHRAPLFEAVVAPSSKLVGKTLKEIAFRESYGGVVVAIGRQAEVIQKSLGGTIIQPGDLLVVESNREFHHRWSRDRDEFYLVSRIKGGSRIQAAGRAPVALLIMAAMVVSAAMNWLPLVTAAFAAALGMIVTRCLRGRQAQAAVDVKVLVVIAAALGIGRAVENVGLSDLLAGALVGSLMPLGTIAVMVGLYVCTNVLTELITHKAAAVLMIPVALAAALESGVDAKAFALVVAVGAAASFITPIGYQTNLMVMSAGGYRYRDFFRIGLPVSLLVMAVAVTMIYLVFV